MKIKKLDIDGGFLDGLDLEFADGLNVLIGPRGSGKTSVIEVLRFCLGIQGVTDSANARAAEHAMFALGDGLATLTYEDHGTEQVAQFRGADIRSLRERTSPHVLFVSQKEIEEIGLDSEGRRRILDALAEDRNEPGPDPTAVVEELAGDLQAVREEIDDVTENLGVLQDAPRLLAEAESELGDREESDGELSELEVSAENLSREVADVAERANALNDSRARLETWAGQLAAVRLEEPLLPELPVEVALTVSESVAAIHKDLESAVNSARKMLDAVDDHHARAATLLSSKRRELSEINSQIEKLEEGAGRLARHLADLREQVARRSALSGQKEKLELRHRQLLDLRSAALDDIAGAANARYDARAAAAEQVNEEFEGEIRVDVIRAGKLGAYEAALGEALEGSRLKWRELAKQVTERMSPRELVEAVDAGDSNTIAIAAGIAEGRAGRLVAHLSQTDTSRILLADVDDDVEFSLLDGKDLKSTARLSLGQRCTVVLPLLLARRCDLTVLDQPEDHLDNAFIVETVVEAIRDLRPTHQQLIATHNANIPVLGGADKVIVMSSSGRRAFVSDEGPLDRESIVATIKRLMEGGEQAFRDRANFYGA